MFGMNYGSVSISEDGKSCRNGGIVCGEQKMCIKSDICPITDIFIGVNNPDTQKFKEQFRIGDSQLSVFTSRRGDNMPLIKLDIRIKRYGLNFTNSECYENECNDSQSVLNLPVTSVLEYNSIIASAKFDVSKIRVHVIKERVIGLAEGCKQKTSMITSVRESYSDTRENILRSFYFVEYMFCFFWFLILLGVVSICARDSLFWTLRSITSLLSIFALSIRLTFTYLLHSSLSSAKSSFISPESCFSSLSHFSALASLSRFYSSYPSLLLLLSLVGSLFSFLSFCYLSIRQKWAFHSKAMKYRVKKRLGVDRDGGESYGSYSEGIEDSEHRLTPNVQYLKFDKLAPKRGLGNRESARRLRDFSKSEIELN